MIHKVYLKAKRLVSVNIILPELVLKMGFGGESASVWFV